MLHRLVEAWAFGTCFSVCVGMYEKEPTINIFVQVFLFVLWGGDGVCVRLPSVVGYFRVLMGTVYEGVWFPVRCGSS